VFENVLTKIQEESIRRKKLETLIEEGRGACLLRDPECADIVQQALEHFDGERYRLIAWVVMPNHVLVLVGQIAGFRLADVVGAWKSFTAKKINKIRNVNGAVWAREYHDRYIRDERHFHSAISYIENNPVKAGLAKHPGDWPYSSAAQQSAGGTPAVPGFGNPSKVSG
jgi:REP element-mobilizing transposase RayT